MSSLNAAEVKQGFVYLLTSITCSILNLANQNFLETENDLFYFFLAFPSNINPASLPVTLMKVSTKLAWQLEKTQLTGLILTLHLRNIGTEISLGREKMTSNQEIQFSVLQVSTLAVSE